MVNVAEHAVGHEFFGGLHVGAEAIVLADHEEEFFLFGLDDEFGGVPGVGRHGLVEHEVLAGLERFEAHAGVQVVGQGDGDDVDIGAFEGLFVIGDEVGDVELIGGFAAALGGDLGEQSDARGGVRLEAADVVEADGTGADDGDVVGGIFLGGHVLGKG